jgi:hypothetical protein
MDNTIDMTLESTYGILDLWLLTPEKFDLQEMGRQLTEMVIGYLKPGR